MTAKFHRRTVILAWVFYVPMIASVFLVREPGGLRISDWTLLAQGFGAALLVATGVMAFSHWSSRRTEWGRVLSREFQEILGGLSSRQILVLSLLSAFGEEILFRGVIHPRIGLWPTAALFAGFHFPFRRRLVPWTVFAGLLGVVLGGLTEWCASLWPPIVLHFAINYFNIHDLAGQPPREEVSPGAVKPPTTP